MFSLDTFKTLKNITIGDHIYSYYDLNKLSNELGFNLNRVPVTKKILLENLIRNEDESSITSEIIINFCKNINTNNDLLEIFFHPTRVLMQDFTGVPAIADLAAMRDALLKKNIDPKIINPKSRVDLVIDHSVIVDNFGSPDSFEKNVEKEFLRNKERYQFLKWGQNSFDNFYLVPPGAGICHQVNLENISQTIWVKNDGQTNLIYPDSVVGTDSHTTMVNALSILGWGVGGIEAEAAMLGQPISMNVPKIVGFEVNGNLNEGITATDLVLTITEKLRTHGVVGKFVEFFGSGLKNLSLADRATISNMAPEYGATCGFFPTDIETINYLKLTGKSDQHLNIVNQYSKLQNLFLDENANYNFDEVINFNLNKVGPTIAGPKRPQDKVLLNDIKNSFTSNFNLSERPRSNENELISGDIVIAAITSCTNTSNPNVMIAAGLVAKKAIEYGLKVKPWVKTSLAPGSKVVSDYLDKSGLTEYLNEIGFNLVGYGCTTCIGNSGPLDKWISDSIKKNNLTVCSVLSGNRNFEGRVHQEVKANYLGSPPLVVIFSLIGNININIDKEPIAVNKEGKNIFLKDLWPSNKEIELIIEKVLSKEIFISRYQEIYRGDKNWSAITTNHGKTYKWNDISTYIKKPPFFDKKFNQINKNIDEARILLMLGDSVTTDHISPAGSINLTSPAGDYLKNRQVISKDFNSYGSRRGNHEIMIRGTFANIRIRNEIAQSMEGGYTTCFINNELMSVYDASKVYEEQKVPLIIIAGKEYGTGSSRDWAAKGTRLLGVKAVIAESFERIHRSNLIGMGVLPFEFTKNENRKSLKIKGNEKINIKNLDLIKPNDIVECEIVNENNSKKINLLCRIDTLKELEYFKAGGILQYVLNSFIKQHS